MRKNNNFIDRSILDILSFLKESAFSDEIALRKGLLQSVNPGIKTAAFLFFIILILFTKNIFILLGIYIVSIILARFSRISLGFFLKRTLIFIPLFSLFIAIPALFSFVTPGDSLVIFKVAGLKLTITSQGLSGAGLFIMRVTTSVSFAVLLSVTTRHFELLRALRIFKIPQVFVMTLGMCYRYIFLFVEIVENTYLAIKSRVGSGMRYKKGQRIVSWNIACLWVRSCKLNQDVYKAMLSRGYKGEA